MWQNQGTTKKFLSRPTPKKILRLGNTEAPHKKTIRVI